jgi:hypothetical protein
MFNWCDTFCYKISNQNRPVIFFICAFLFILTTINLIVLELISIGIQLLLHITGIRRLRLDALPGPIGNNNSRLRLNISHASNSIGINWKREGF